MRIRRAGLIRLWIVLSVIFVPTLSELDFLQRQQFWNGLANIAIQHCVDDETKPPYEDGLKCAHRFDADKTVFEREHTTPAAYWSTTLFWSFVADLMLTAMIVGTYLIVRWVWNGFARPSTLND